MIKMIQTWVISNLFVHSFKQLEKTNWVTISLAKCFTIPKIKLCWSVFCDSVISLFEDAINEVKAAKKWK